jgi:16S rRNA (cytosine967-C5)-methyltransferase
LTSPVTVPAATARRVALDALIAVEHGGRANVVVPRLLAAGSLQARDRNLVTELVYGTCRMQRACDWLTDRYRKDPVDVEVRSALRLGAYQIGWTRIPAHAAVSATVGEVRGPGRSVVNAVLRRVAAESTHGTVTWPNRATQLSYPDWIVDRLARDIGQAQAEAALEQMNRPATVTVRSDGYIQDQASQLVAAHLTPAPGAVVADLCAAPGGKATAFAQGPGVLVAATDLSEPRCRLLVENASRLGLERMATVIGDGCAPPYRRHAFDLVLVDAPCSGLGVLRRRPDARWRVHPGDVDRLAALQRRLLTAAKSLVRPGGILAYSVCTMTGSETAGIDNWLARTAPELKPMPPPGDPWQPAGRGALVLPQTAGTDGMFLLALRAD